MAEIVGVGTDQFDARAASRITRGGCTSSRPCCAAASPPRRRARSPAATTSASFVQQSAEALQLIAPRYHALMRIRRYLGAALCDVQCHKPLVRQEIVTPLSTGRTWPVTMRDSSLAR